MNSWEKRILKNDRGNTGLTIEEITKFRKGRKLTAHEKFEIRKLLAGEIDV